MFPLSCTLTAVTNQPLLLGTWNLVWR